MNQIVWADLRPLQMAKWLASSSLFKIWEELLLLGFGLEPSPAPFICPCHLKKRTRGNVAPGSPCFGAGRIFRGE
jgi:hypothetical protein